MIIAVININAQAVIATTAVVAAGIAARARRRAAADTGTVAQAYADGYADCLARGEEWHPEPSTDEHRTWPAREDLPSRG